MPNCSIDIDTRLPKAGYANVFGFMFDRFGDGGIDRCLDSIGWW